VFLIDISLHHQIASVGSIVEPGELSAKQKQSSFGNSLECNETKTNI